MLQAQHITQQKNAQDHGVENLILQRSKKIYNCSKATMTHERLCGSTFYLVKVCDLPHHRTNTA